MRIHHPTIYLYLHFSISGRDSVRRGEVYILPTRSLIVNRRAALLHRDDRSERARMLLMPDESRKGC